MKSALLTLVLTSLYVLAILPARLIALLLGRDPLLLRKPEGVNSYWLPKPPVTDVQCYFSQGHPESKAGDATPRGATSWVLPLYLGLARLFSPKRRSAAETRTSSASREQGIPDEIYTLW